MIKNVVLRLRAERLVRVTRPFPARGNRIRCCQRCLLPPKQRLCAILVPAQATSRFCLVMFDTEPMKLNNTGRLIADILPDIEAFQWSRTELPQGLLNLVAHPDHQPIVVLPISYAGPERQILSAPLSGKPSLFIVLDGIWTEVHKMFHKSPYLDVLSIIFVDLLRISVYHLREAHADGQYCTAEIAIALPDLAGDVPAVAMLGEHFTHFRTRCLTGKTQHKGSIIADQVENV